MGDAVRDVEPARAIVFGTDGPAAAADALHAVQS